MGFEPLSVLLFCGNPMKPVIKYASFRKFINASPSGAKGSAETLAKKYGVCVATVWTIFKNRKKALI